LPLPLQCDRVAAPMAPMAEPEAGTAALPCNRSLPQHSSRVHRPEQPREASPLGVQGTILQRAIEAVPAMRYALAVAGLAAVVSIIVTILGLDPRVAIIGALVVIALMFLLLVFSSVTRGRQSPSLRLLAVLLAWAYSILTFGSTVLLASSFLFGVPLELQPIRAPSGPRLDAPTILVHVIDSAGGPIVGAHVTVDGHRFDEVTKNDGNVRAGLPGVTIGQPVTVRVRATGFKFAARDVLVDSLTHGIGFTLQRFP
jgi:hypothetical protein